MDTHRCWGWTEAHDPVKNAPEKQDSRRPTDTRQAKTSQPSERPSGQSARRNTRPSVSPASQPAAAGLPPACLPAPCSLLTVTDDAGWSIHASGDQVARARRTRGTRRSRSGDAGPHAHARAPHVGAACNSHCEAKLSSAGEWGHLTRCPLGGPVENRVEGKGKTSLSACPCPAAFKYGQTTL